ncbi:hypothetical protein FRACYDRAFT_233403 [Fragilariopsis cylindrus CCMP1102]|uniref:Uncharacterized protein n=1 Tax=Fragilariopsis cylindrus CCMP1102 TaxID=635003 RepID=A0A1E7FZK2_9STRA|nr:hypothetical protein FRACYDRAFT_233403 [Fragilariopsis cylindrus CCMP1102]|eukprot:OEU23233.1 hypothetical protein FRACYDRAFT_233403 [Fragilariopsis cylindrus CCMP1102]
MEGTRTSNDNDNDNDKQNKDKYELPPKLKLLLQPTRRKLQKRPGNNLNYNNSNNNNKYSNNSAANDTTNDNNNNAASKVVSLSLVSVHQNRKPRGYWKNITNIEYELRTLWTEKAIQISDNAVDNDDNNDNDNDKLLINLLYPPPIPNEALLNYWNRHDIRNAIRSYGGRTLLAEDLQLLASLLISTTTSATSAVPSPIMPIMTTTTTSNGLVAMSRSSRSSSSSLISSNSKNSSSLSSTTTTTTTTIPGKWKDMIGMNHPLVIKVIQNDKNLNFIKAPSTTTTTKSTIVRTTTTSKKKNKLLIEQQQQEEEQQEQEQEQQEEEDQNNRSQSHTKRNRRDYGRWSKEKVIDVLYKYLNERKRKYNIPSIWMPRLSELEKNIFNISIISSNDNGRDDTDDDTETNFGYLKHAIANYYGTVDNYGQAGPTSNSIGGVDQLCCDAGLIPYYEWRYIEGQHDLLIALKEYIDDKNNNDNDNDNHTGYSTTWRNDGYKSLFRLVQDYGGVDFVSGRFGMMKESKKKKENKRSYMYWGTFDIEFGILLMEYIRLDQLQKVPKMSLKMNNNSSIYKSSRSNTICMPTKKELLSKSKLSPSSILLLLKKKQHVLSLEQDGHQQEQPETQSPSLMWGEYLHKKIIEYGGYENVARRLGLHWE